MRKIKNKTAFSLIELMLAFAIVVIVFAAVVPQFRAIRNSWATTEAGAAIIQNGRVLAEHFSRNLSSAKRITAVSGSSDTNGYITFEDNTGVAKRYMLSGGYVLFGNVGSEAQLAGPVSSFRIICYSLNDFMTPATDVNTIRLVKFETIFPNDNTLGSDKTFQSEVFIQTNAQAAADQSVIDIMVKSGQPDTAFDYTAGDNGCNAVIDIDKNPLTHGLLWFKDIVGDANNQVPADTQITQAKIKLWYVNHNSNSDVDFYRMNVPWTETSTWDSIGGGINPPANCDAASVITDRLGSSVPLDVEIDVKDIAQGWINGDYPNYGFGIINSSNNNIQFAAAENTTGTDANTPRLTIGYRPTPVVNIGIIGSWIVGTTHAREAGTNRALVFLAHSYPGSSVTLTAVSYGGQPMTYVIDRTGGSGTNRTYVAAFILNEAGIAAASGSNFALTWSGAEPARVGYSSVFLQNVDQTTLTGASDWGWANNANVATSALATNNGDIVIEAAACNNTGAYTVSNGFTEALELVIPNADGVDGYKFATGADETPRVNHNPSGRQTLIGFVVKAPEVIRIFGGGTIGSQGILP